MTRTEGQVDELLSHRATLRDGRVVLERIPNAYTDTPYWIIQTTAEITDGHSGLQNPNLAALINQIYEINGAYDIGRRQWILTGD